MDLGALSALQNGAVLLACALVIAVAGPRLVAVVEAISERTGFGDALSGAVLIGIATSLSGTVLSVSAAHQGHTDLAVSNAAGGIVMQTFFLVIGDLSYRRVNIEHAAASLENLLQAALSVVMMSFVLLLTLSPGWTLLAVHPGTLLLPCVYLVGLHVVHESRLNPQWLARKSLETGEELPHGSLKRPPLPTLLLRFVLLAAVLGLAGLLLTVAAVGLSEQTGLSQTVLGVLLTSLITSLPELVTTLTAIRRGFLTLAVGNIIGGNTFDVLFLAAADVAYRNGSIYHVMSDDHRLTLITGILMTSIIAMGLLRRERRGPAAIGLESVTVALVFAAFVALLLLRPA